jgi:peptidoglycan/xylan/chitin deacetylase (PgdA/CDA1 family)
VSAPSAPALSIVVLARGPERLADRALAAALSQSGPGIELVVVGDAAAIRRAQPQNALAQAAPPVCWVESASAGAGAARNAGVRAGRGRHVLLADGGEVLEPGYASVILERAAASGASLVLPVRRAQAPLAAWAPITLDDAVPGPWCFGSALLATRDAFERLGGFDERLPEFVEWEWLLRALAASECSLAAPEGAARPADDDVRLRESLRSERHLPAIRQIVARHRAVFDAHAVQAIAGRDRLIAELDVRERTLRASRQQAESELAATRAALAGVAAGLAPYGRRTLEFEDLRRTSPVSRNWGLDRGMPIDRRYIHAFMGRHAADVRGDVLEMLDAELTTSYGRDRVVASDVLDIDPGNQRATVVADLRVAEQMPENAYDCFILTQTLHLIDDMAGVLANAHRALKPGGVLLLTLPCASMVAVEYGPRGDHWRFTEAGARALVEQAFDPASIEVRGYGNVLATTAFLYGLGCDDLDPAELEEYDPAYPMLVTVRAQKAATPAVTTPVARVPTSCRPSAVLLYHRVSALDRDVHQLAITPQAFRSQLEALTRAWRVVPLAELMPAAVSGRAPDGHVALTFDDGYLDNLDLVLPLLEEFSAPATFFLTTASLGAPGRYWWDVLEAALLDNPALGAEVTLEIDGGPRRFATHDAAACRTAHDALYAILKVSAPPRRDAIVGQLGALAPCDRFDARARPLLLDEVRRLARHPLVDIGAHTVHHLSLSLAAADDLHRDVFEGRSALERAIGRAVPHFAYPYGDLSPAAVQTVQAAGFSGAVTCEARVLRRREHPLRVPRLATFEEGGAALGARLAALAA